ncbi:uncharacterized protein LOC113276506 isoform X2 [Papaver somniferum]|nr:uncharacterized protein LOC113276506 isoform X2 [Papaver somniferum]
MDIHSSNLDGIGGDDNDVVNVILWSGGRISDRSGNEPMYSSGLNMFQKVSNSGGHVEMSEGEGGGFCDKQARGCCGSSSCGCIPFGHMNSVPCMLQQARVRLSDILLLGCFLVCRLLL